MANSTASAQPEALLFDAFVVCGLAVGEPLTTVQGEPGFQASADARYKPSVVDCVSQPGRTAKLPMQLAMVRVLHLGFCPKRSCCNSTILAHAVLPARGRGNSAAR